MLPSKNRDFRFCAKCRGTSIRDLRVRYKECPIHRMKSHSPNDSFHERINVSSSTSFRPLHAV
jgi:hypothetical protein